MKIEKNISLRFDKTDTEIICYDASTLQALFGTTSVAGNNHIYGIKKVGGNYHINIEKYKEVLKKTIIRKERLDNIIETMRSVIGVTK